MGQKRNRESNCKNLVLKTMQIRTEYNCNFICFIMPHYPRPLIATRWISLVSALRRLMSRRGASLILSQPHVAQMRYAACSSFNLGRRAVLRWGVLLVRQPGYLGSIGTFDVVRHQWSHNVHPAQKNPIRAVSQARPRKYHEKKA